jgi:(E)-4-hydroxy-3-methylbut-2-enyl-diphosphate synthase
MGCEVNGPGEAREADVGIAFGKDRCLLFQKGEIVGRHSPNEVTEALFRLLDDMK